MITKVTAKVTAVSEHSEYYPLTGKYTQSTLTVAENSAQVTGTVSVREKLAFGEFYSIIINTADAAPLSLPLSPAESEKL